MTSMYAQISGMMNRKEREAVESTHRDAQVALSAASRKVLDKITNRKERAAVQKALWELEDAFNAELGIDEDGNEV